MPKRIRNWKVHLVRWATTNIGKSFNWGETDCASLLMKACGVMYHADLFPNIDDYSSLRGAKKVFDGLDSDFGPVLEDAGAKEIPYVYMTAGDLAVGGVEADHGFPTAHVVLPRCVLSSDPERNVFTFDRLYLENETTIYRLPDVIE